MPGGQKGGKHSVTLLVTVAGVTIPVFPVARPAVSGRGSSPIVRAESEAVASLVAVSSLPSVAVLPALLAIVM